MSDPVPGDAQVAQDFAATRALAQRPDPGKAFDALFPPAAAAATAMTPPAAAPIDPSQPIADRVVNAATATAPPAPSGFFARIRGAATSGALDGLRDLATTGTALAGGKVGGAAPAADYATPLKWGDLLHPAEALTKATYQIAHGAPVVAAGFGGAAIGGTTGAETGAEAGTLAGPEGTVAGGIAGGATGALAGGAIGAGAMSAAQALGPFYAVALKANPNDPTKAWDQALARAGAAGAFTSAGWALFGLKPFTGAVQNLLFQAFGVQPAVGAAGKVADNAASGQPLGQGVADSIPGSIVGTALPATAHAVVGALVGAPPAADGAPAPAANLAASGEGAPATEPTSADPAAGGAPPAPQAAAEGGATAAAAPGVVSPDAAAATPMPPPTTTAETAGAPAPAAEGDKPGAPAAPKQTPDAMPIGDAKADPVTISPDIEKNALAYIDGKTGENPVKVNLGYIGTDNIADTLARVSSQLPGQDVQSHEQTTALALGLGLQPDQFLAGYKGQQLDAAQTTAMRLMLDSSAQQLVQFATAATDPHTGSPAAMAQFLRAYATHQGIQQYFENARAEAGRTLNAYQIMSRTSSDMTKAIGDLVNNAGGATEVQKLAQQIADLNDPEKVNQAVAASRRMTARDFALYGYYNVILSNIPHVLAKKLTSDVLAATWEMGTRFVAGNAPGSSGEVQAGEAAQMAYGYASAFRDAVRLAGRGIATGEHQFDAMSGNTLDPIGAKVSLAAEDAPPAITPDQPTRGAVDYLKMALPVRWIGAADDFAKYMNYRAELRALAYRYAIKSGTAPGDLDGHVEEIMAAPSDDMHQQAVSNALRTTFQEPLTGVAKAIQNTADQINIPLPGTDFKIPFGRMVLPFVKIPSNLLGWVYRNSPVAAAFPTEQIKADIAAGGARRDMAVTRMALGSGLAMAAAGLAVNGQITGRGPSNPDLNRAWRAAGNQPYSITIGGRPYGYSQVDPMGMFLGAIADSYDIMRFAPEQSRGDVASSLAFGLGGALLSKTYLQGLSSFFDALQTPDREAGKYVDRFIGSMAAPGAAKGVADATDPWMRAHYSLLDGIEARLPMVSQDLPPDRTLWGDPIPKQDGFIPAPGLSGTGVARAISPVTYGPPSESAEPIDKWIWENRAAFPHSDTGQLDLRKPGAVQSFAMGPKVNVPLQLSPAQLDRFQEQAGNGLKMPGTGLGAKDFLNALVRGDNPDADAQRNWNQADPAMRALIVQKVVSGMRGAAKKQLLVEFPDLRDAVQMGAYARAAQLSGANSVREGAGP